MSHGALAALVVCAALGGCARPAPRAHTVEIAHFAFAPARLEVAAGDTIVWVNHDMVPHTATSAAGGWDSGGIEPDQSRRTVVTRPGTQAYVCSFHPNMRAELVVR